jgi:phosphoglycolate phosphatase-like HAD superfamily hydrolase
MKLLLFDIDGTLLKLQSNRSKVSFMNLLSNEFGREIPAKVLPSFAGMTDRLIIRLIAENVGYPLDELAKKIDKIEKAICDDFESFVRPELIHVFPGAKELVEKLSTDPDFSLGLLTGNFKRNAYLKVRLIGLDHLFPFGAFGNDRENRNELPPIALERANKHHESELFTSENCIIIGDSERDIECGHSNNIAVLAVATGYQTLAELQEHQPDAAVEDFSDTDRIVRILKKM